MPRTAVPVVCSEKRGSDIAAIKLVEVPKYSGNLENTDVVAICIIGGRR